MNASLGAIAQAAQGLEAWGVNARMLLSGQSEATTYASALRTLYSGGSQASDERNLYERILSGQTDIVENSDGHYGAVTEYDATQGKHTIVLGRDALSDGSRFGMNILLSHEAYRNGIDDGAEGQVAETQRAVLGHIQAAGALGSTYGLDSLSDVQLGEVQALQAAYAGDSSQIAKVLGGYESSGDYWMLKKDGSIAYDGFATLRDEDGNIIKSAIDMGVKETQIEGSLIKILGVDPKNQAQVEALRQMMVNSGMQHSFSYDSDQWSWGGTQTVAFGVNGSFPRTASIDLSRANQGNSIDLQDISDFYSSIDASKKTVDKFIDGTYGSAIGLLNYAGTGFKSPAEQLLASVYSKSEVKTIQANQAWYNKAVRNGISVDSMITGGASRTSAFGIDTGDLSLSTSSVPGAAFFREQHTGIDYGSGGDTVQTPGGAWQFIKQRDEYKAYFQLFGGDMKMRIMHIDPSEIQALTVGKVYGASDVAKKLFDYPTVSFGTGTGAHVHVDFTRRLPYAGTYDRQFVNPETLQPGSRFDYTYSYKDISHILLPGYPKDFNRY